MRQESQSTKHLFESLTLSGPISQNGQTHSKKSSRQFADELFECV